MRRALLIFAGLFITACFSMYIFEIDLSGRDDHIGHQNDLAAANIIELKDDTAAAATKDRRYGTTAVKTERRDPPAAAEGPVKTGGYPENLSGWKLLWEDEFDKRSIDMEYWTEVDRGKNYNNELQYFLPENSFTENGYLCLVAKKEKCRGKDYTSAMVETRDKLSVLYGRVEVRAKLPAGKGIFPAIWMLAEDGSFEIDIMEMIGSEPNIIYGVNHYKRNGPRKTYGYVYCDTPEKYHVYAVEWDNDEMRWYFDGMLFHISGRGVSTKDMYIVLTLAVGGDWPGDPGKETSFPCSMKVDYVRVYKRN